MGEGLARHCSNAGLKQFCDKPEFRLPCQGLVELKQVPLLGLSSSGALCLTCQASPPLQGWGSNSNPCPNSKLNVHSWPATP
jgi:hypothetical protein